MPKIPRLPKRDKNRIEREAKYKESQHYLLLGYSQTETASMMNVSRQALGRWITTGHINLPSAVEIKAYRVENGLSDGEVSAEAPPLLEGGRVIRMWGDNDTLPKKVTPQLIADEMERQRSSGESFDSRVRDDYSVLYTRWILRLRNMAESALNDPQVLLNWVRALELVADRIRKIEAESNDRDDPEDVVAERRELQQRRERLSGQYQKMSAGEEEAS